jgi:periplasmic protein TonB
VSAHYTNDPRGRGPSPLARALTSRRRGRPPGRALLGTVLLHGIIVFAAAGTSLFQPPEDSILKFKAYRVELYSPPPQVEGPPEPAREAPLPAIVKKPTPPEPKPEVKEPPKPEVKAPPKPEVKAPPVARKKPATTPKAEETVKRSADNSKRPVSGRNAKPGPIGGEGLNVLQEGQDFPYPEYLGNIIRQFNRYFRWDGAGNLEGEIGFYIKRDGTIGGLRVVKRSGEYRFDMAAADAVNNASRARAFGPLPAGFNEDSLNILFSYRPGR